MVTCGLVLGNVGSVHFVVGAPQTPFGVDSSIVGWQRTTVVLAVSVADGDWKPDARDTWFLRRTNGDRMGDLYECLRCHATGSRPTA